MSTNEQPHSHDSRSPQEEPRKERPTVVENILGGGARIKFLSEHPETREVGFRPFQGTVYSYELDVPHLTNPGERWITEVGVWFPASYHPLFDERLKRKPEMQIDILTGQGHMPLTKNQETMRKIYEEIRRQTDAKEVEIQS